MQRSTRVSERTVTAALVIAAVLTATHLTATTASATGSAVSGAGTAFYLNDSFSGSANTAFSLNAAAGASVYVGDWDGNGIDTIMVRNGARFTTFDSNRTNSTSTSFSYGEPTDAVLVGDWDGNGTDTVAVRRGSTFHLRNANSSGVADIVVQYGDPGDAVLVGDWDGNSTDTLAVWRSPQFHIRNTLTPGAADQVIEYGDPGDVVVVGDWDGDNRDSLGVVRGEWFHLRNQLSSGRSDVALAYGDPGDIRFVGDWNGDRRDTVGVRRTCLSAAGATCATPGQAIGSALQIVNAHRANAALPALTSHPGLGSLAQSWSEQMAAARSMVHNPNFGATSRSYGFRGWGENIARTGSTDAGRVMELWMNSPGHRANILNPAFTDIGIGVAQGSDGGWYWTQNFGIR